MDAGVAAGQRERARAEEARRETANVAANEARLRIEADRVAKEQERKREQDRAAAAEARTRAAAEAARQAADRENEARARAVQEERDARIKAREEQTAAYCAAEGTRLLRCGCPLPPDAKVCSK